MHPVGIKNHENTMIQLKSLIHSKVFLFITMSNSLLRLEDMWFALPLILECLN